MLNLNINLLFEFFHPLFYIKKFYYILMNKFILLFFFFYLNLLRLRQYRQVSNKLNFLHLMAFVLIYYKKNYLIKLITSFNSFKAYLAISMPFFKIIILKFYFHINQKIICLLMDCLLKFIFLHHQYIFTFIFSKNFLLKLINNK